MAKRAHPRHENVPFPAGDGMIIAGWKGVTNALRHVNNGAVSWEEIMRRIGVIIGADINPARTDAHRLPFGTLD